MLIEVTRRCNLKCEHCIRGKAENRDITQDVINRIANECDDEIVTLTGGEPTLSKNLWTILRGSGFKPSILAIVSNFQVWKKKWWTECLEYCSCHGIELHIAMSDNPWTQEQQEKRDLNYMKLKALTEQYSVECSMSKRKMDWNSKIINEGYAEDNCIGSVSLETYEDLDDVKHDMTVTVDGDIIPVCNYSYKRAKLLSLGNIKNITTLDALARYNQKETQEVLEILYCDLDMHIN